MSLHVDLAHLLLSLALLAVIALAGTAIVRRLVPESPGSWTLLMGAPFGLALWSNVVALSVAAAIPLRWLAVPLLLTTLAVATGGVAGLGRMWPATQADRRRVVVLGTLAMMCGMVAILPYILLGFDEYPGSRLPDGWAYAAYGQYLWRYGHGTQGLLEPLYLYALTLLHARHVASGTLAVLSVIVAPGDTQLAIPYFQFVGVAAFASACGAFAVANGASLRPSSLFVTLAAMSGWVSNVMWANNHDNLLALVYFPAAAAIVASGHRLGLGSGVVFGIVAAALLHAYPEFAVFSLACIAILAAGRLHRRRALASERQAFLAALGVGLAIFSPAIVPLGRFLTNQLAAGLSTSAAPRPGAGMFPGLLSAKTVLAAVWALGAEHQRLDLFPVQLLIGAGLTVVLLLAVARHAWHRDWSWLACLALVACAAATLLVVQRYDYGTYKILLIGWWLIAWSLAMAVCWLLDRQGVTRLAGVAALGVVCALPAVGMARAVATVITRPPHGMSDYRQLRSMAGLAGNEPIGLLVDDLEGTEWALYYLRDRRSRVGDFSGYIASAGARALLEQDGQYPWSRIPFVLTDARDGGPIIERQGWTLIGQTAAYRLWETAETGWAVVTDVTPAVVVAGTSTSVALRVVAGSEGCARLVPPETARSVGTDEGQDAPPSSIAAAFWVPAGPSSHQLRGVSDAHGVAPSQLTDAALEFVAPKVRETGLVNPNGLDVVANTRFLWLGGGATRIQLTANQDQPARLTADLRLGPSAAANRTTRRLRVRLPGALTTQDIEVGAGKWVLDFVAPAGTSTLTIEPLDEVTVHGLPNGDPRPLLLGAAHLDVAAVVSPETCAGVR